MNDKDYREMFSVRDGDHLPNRLWADDDYTNIDVKDPPADFVTDLTGLGFIRAALRRSKRFWCATAVVGLLAGASLYVASPTSYQAQTSLFLTPGPTDNSGQGILDDQAIAQSSKVAGLALHKLGVQESVSSLLASYTVTVVTDRVLLIMVNAPSSYDALSRARALATEFLRFRADQMETDQTLALASLNQQINQGKQHIKGITAQLSRLSAQSAPPAQQAKRRSLRTELSQATSALNTLEQYTYTDKATTQVATSAALQGSKVLDPASLIPPRSRLKRLLIYAATGLIIGLALGLSIVVVRALTSNRLRRRDDVAYALGAPVKLSVGTVRLSRWLPGRHGLTAARAPNVQRIVAHLGNAVPPSSHGPASLAIVAVDDVQVPAVCLVSLAESFAQQGKQTLVADLAKGAPAARLLGVGQPGVLSVRVDGARLIVAVPEHDDVGPVGPLGRTSRQVQRSPLTEAVTAASPEVLLTLASLDPSLDAGYLSTWATNAVVMITAGRSSWTKIHAVGEMIRLTATRLVSAVLVGADKTDESLGVMRMAGAGGPAEVVEERLGSDARESSPRSARIQVEGRSTTADPRRGFEGRPSRSLRQ